MSRTQYCWRRIRCRVCRRASWAIDTRERVSADKLRKGNGLPVATCEDCYLRSLQPAPRAKYLQWANAVCPPRGREGAPWQ